MRIIGDDESWSRFLIHLPSQSVGAPQAWLQPDEHSPGLMAFAKKQSGSSVFLFQLVSKAGGLLPLEDCST